jgi:hypothetical protein
MTDMRRLMIVALVTTASVAAGATATTVGARTARVSVRGGISFRLPAGWHLVRGWLSDVAIPIPRFAVGSFAARLSRHTCECGMPNVRHFPRRGAFLFVWEYPDVRRAALARAPVRPARFRIGRRPIQGFECAGPSGGLAFRDAGRVFQVEVYVGPDAGAQTRAEMGALLDSLRETPGPVSAAAPRAPVPG